MAPKSGQQSLGSRTGDAPLEDGAGEKKTKPENTGRTLAAISTISELLMSCRAACRTLTRAAAKNRGKPPKIRGLRIGPIAVVPTLLCLRECVHHRLAGGAGVHGRTLGGDVGGEHAAVDGGGDGGLDGARFDLQPQ